MRIEGSRSVDIAVAPDVAWKLVADVTRMCEWSPHIVSANWIPPATGPAAGSRFSTTVRLPFVRRWTNVSTVIESELGLSFAFAVGVEVDDPNTQWSYGFESIPTGTRVTERWQMLREPRLVLAYYRLIGQERRLAAGVEQTLARLKRHAEVGPVGN